MANLVQEYMDIKNVKHKVEHLVISMDEKGNRERIIEEVFQALTRPSKHMPA